MLQHMQEEVEQNKERSSTKRKGKAAERPKVTPAPAASGSATSGSLPAGTGNPAVQPSLHKLQQQRDLKRAELDRMRAQMHLMEEEYQAAETELHRQAQGGLLEESPGQNIMGVAATADRAQRLPLAENDRVARLGDAWDPNACTFAITDRIASSAKMPAPPQ